MHEGFILNAVLNIYIYIYINIWLSGSSDEKAPLIPSSPTFSSPSSLLLISLPPPPPPLPPPPRDPACTCLPTWTDQGGEMQEYCPASTYVPTYGYGAIDPWCPTYNECFRPDGQNILGDVSTPWIYCTPLPPRPPLPPPPAPELELVSKLTAFMNASNLVTYSIQLCQAVNQYLNNTGRISYVRAQNCDSSTRLYISLLKMSSNTITTHFSLVFSSDVSSATIAETWSR